ncbi:STAS domain-containing protein [Aneurinibacillus sp. REN35]|uniref:hypothetical protein n=1 Tax=Aneurinibacillus sp. REN35 TaxID=3237286 RepID=UPI00352856F8
MMSSNPCPYFMIDQTLSIVQTSEEAAEVFGSPSTILDVIDEESLSKALRFLHVDVPTARIELTMRTLNNPLSLFEVHIRWHGGAGHMFCVQQDQRIQRLSSLMEQLQGRLAATDFALLEKKEELEHAMERIHQLSGSFIRLTNRIGLVPLFGSLTADKMQAICTPILQESYHIGVEKVLFDFTAVTDFTREGVEQLQVLFGTLNIMGQIQSIAIGITPQQARYMNQAGIELNARFIGSLQQAIERFVL